MTDIERRLREAMLAAVDGELPPADLVGRVLRMHRRYLARAVGAAVVGAVLLAAVPVAFALRGADHGRPQPIASASSGSPAHSPSPSPRSSHPPRHAHSRPEPVWMRGLPLPPATDLRLLLAARDPAWFSTASGGITTIAGLPRSRYPYTFVRVRGGWDARPSPKVPACTPDCPDPRMPVYLIADGSTVARRVAVTQETAPGAGHVLLWLETYPPGTTNASTTRATAQPVSASGQPAGAAVRLPTGYGIQQQVGRYLLLSPDLQGPGPVIFKLWDPMTSRVVRTFRNVVAASASQIAWSICAGCAMHVLDLRTGRSELIGVPSRTWPYDGLFSSGGRFLAVHLSGGVTANGYATLGRIAVIDLATRRLQVLVGSRIGTDAPAVLIFGWRGGSDTLIAAVTTAHPTAQIGTWHPGAVRLRVRRISVPRGMTVVLGPYG